MDSNRITYPTLSKAPIVEAIFDVQARINPEISPEDIEALGKTALAEDYPKTETERVVSHQIGGRTGETPDFATREGVRGFRFISPEGGRIVQFRRDGFTFNKLSPYGSFEDYLPDVIRLWSIFVEGARVVEVTRIALRFINRIEIPVPEDQELELDRYFRIGPRIPASEVFVVSGFLNRLTLMDRESELTANVALTDQPRERGVFRSVLDIDAFKREQSNPENAAIREIFENLRTLKNRIFFESVTDECLELFK